MAKETVNSFLSMSKALRQRLAQLNELKNEVATKTSWGDSDRKVKEPTYSVKQVETKIASINSALYKIDKEIKKSNALTSIEVDVDFETLISPLE
jgi:septal ring factor EnvC (AmiA/AmiB activator)